MGEKLGVSLILTLIFELIYAYFWGVKGKDIRLVLLMNVLTNPLVVLWNSWTAGAGYVISTVLPELSAIFTEAYLLKRFGKNIPYPIALAICINLFSYIIGLFLSYFFKELIV